jgi:hypothetical protein
MLWGPWMHGSGRMRGRRVDEGDSGIGGVSWRR